MPSDPSSPTVYVVDDDSAVLDALSLLLRSVGLPTATYLSGRAFLEAHRPEWTGCLVLDVRMPGLSGLEVQRELRQRGSTLPIIFLTAHGDVPMAVEAMKGGAAEFLQKPFRDQDLIDAIQHALARAAREREHAASRRDVETRIASLTPRERQVMRMVVDGKANKVIAAELGISQRTVEIHRSRVMQKMEVASLSQLVRAILQDDT